MPFHLAASQIFSKVREVGPDRGLVDRVRIKVGIVPLDHALVVEVLGIRDRLQERLVAGRAADIGGGAATPRAGETGVFDGGGRPRRAPPTPPAAPRPPPKQSRTERNFRPPHPRPPP